MIWCNDISFLFIIHINLTGALVWILNQGLGGGGGALRTLDPRLPFPNSVWEIFPGPITIQKVYQANEWFSPDGDATMIDSF